MRQASVRAIQAVVRALPDGACADHQETIDRVKALGRRDAIDAELAVEVQALWREMPITDAVVQTVDAHVFERAAIEHWFRLGHRTNPLTNEELF